MHLMPITDRLANAFSIQHPIGAGFHHGRGGSPGNEAVGGSEIRKPEEAANRLFAVGQAFTV